MTKLTPAQVRFLEKCDVGEVVPKGAEWHCIGCLMPAGLVDWGASFLPWVTITPAGREALASHRAREGK